MICREKLRFMFVISIQICWKLVKNELNKEVTNSCLSGKTVILSPIKASLIFYYLIYVGLGEQGSLIWVEGDAEKLNFEDDSMDGYIIAFGIRNVTHRKSSC